MGKQASVNFNYDTEDLTHLEISLPEEFKEDSECRESFISFLTTVPKTLYPEIEYKYDEETQELKFTNLCEKSLCEIFRNAYVISDSRFSGKTDVDEVMSAFKEIYEEVKDLSFKEMISKIQE